eukprot:11517524-Prorocentrum_lima.AAC.1
MAGEQLVVRFHSDAGSEFWNKEVFDLLNKNLMMQTDCWIWSKGKWQGREICWHPEKKSNIICDPCWH